MSVLQPFIDLADWDGSPIVYRIPDLLPMNCSVLISAFQKTGKSTFVFDLMRALTTGDDFLGRSCKQLSGPVVYVNFELNRDTLWQYAHDLDIDMESREIKIHDYRGYASKFLIMDDIWRQDYADALIDLDAKALVIDPIHPVMVGKADSNDNDMAREVLEHLSEIARDASLSHLIVVDHTGKADRGTARGASSKGDWGDVLWNIQGEKTAPRTLHVSGRGPLHTLKYTLDKGRLVLVDNQGRTQQDADRERVRELYDKEPNLSFREAEKRLPGMKKDKIRELKMAMF